VPTREQEVAALHAQVDAAERVAQNLRERLATLEKDDQTDNTS
jgi:ubiquinone biosynthesis protein UbiJ